MSKKIVICADGTWNTDTETDKGTSCPTNVTKIARAIQPEDSAKIPQIIYYHSGVGTNWGQKFLGGTFGAGLFDNVVDCYRFIVNNYIEGDSLFFFGFSRGAFTVRSLAGLIRNSGILQPGHEQFEAEAVALYRDRSDSASPNSQKAQDFRTQHSFDSEIHFIGVWDTVGALGVPDVSAKGYEFHDVSLSKKVHYAYHALSIHEHRAPFLPTLWTKQADAPDTQVLEQTWFAGAHSDVGGGYAESGLSDVALKWMIEKAEDAGLLIDKAHIPTFSPDPLADGHDSCGVVYNILNFLEGHPDGAYRIYGQKLPDSHESIAASVGERFVNKPGEHWPPTFLAALNL